MSSTALPRQIRGPSAFGGGLRRTLYLTWIIGLTEYRLTYFGSALGYLWSLMRPLMLFGVLYVVFSEIVDFGDDIVNYPMLLLFNIVLFNFFTDASTKAVTSVVDREAIVRKMHFPGMVIPFARVLSGGLNLAVSLIAVFLFLLAYGLNPRWTWLLLPLLLVPLVLLTLGVAMLLSALYVRFRDVAPIWAVLSTALFYGSPVLYAIDKVPEQYRQMLMLVNPLADILEQGRRWVIDPNADGAIAAAGGGAWILVPIAVGTAVCALGVWVFNREAPRIAERL
ncbi:MAG: ABC transporter permease [Thermoleophilaceae bacterium]|nr:ABC transporter permease [Thermoleophilaceae bacterium]